ncbi:MAG: hypothetical protein CMA67_04680 [Euryarchaeota archaeon]|nr:hypothetical protein [Euryarchaeota archaeon]
MTSSKEGNRFTLISFVAVIIMLSYTGYDTVVYRAEVISSFAEENEYVISFSIQNETMQLVETLQDDETRNVIFELSDIAVPEGFSIGLIEVTITSEEEEGVSVQCDSVAGDIIENDLTAQWNDTTNDLSGQDSSCAPIELNLRVYPDFTGETVTVSAINEFQAVQKWTETGWGVGDLSIDLDLDVNSPLGFDPVGQDTDEEITVDVTVVLFSLSIQQV